MPITSRRSDIPLLYRGLPSLWWVVCDGRNTGRFPPGITDLAAAPTHAHDHLDRLPVGGGRESRQRTRSGAITHSSDVAGPYDRPPGSYGRPILAAFVVLRITGVVLYGIDMGQCPATKLFSADDKTFYG